MSGGAEVDVSELQRELRQIDARVTDLSPITPVIAETLVALVSEEFESAGRGRWAPLEPSTLAKRRGSTAQILKDTGRFAASIRAEHGPDFAAAVTDVSYAVYHVSDAPRTVIPLRNPFDVADLAEPEVIDLIVRYCVGGSAA
jgi:phage gpG-like protein